MDEADALGLEAVCAHCGDQLGAAARGEDESDAAAGARIAARRGNEISQRRGALAAGDAAAVVGILAARRGRAIRRIGDDQVESRGRDARDSFRRTSAHIECTDSRPLMAALRTIMSAKRWLDFQRDDFARAVEGGDRDRHDTASCAEVEHAIASARARETAEQDRFDRKAVAVRGLYQRDRTVEDRIASFVFVD